MRMSKLFSHVSNFSFQLSVFPSLVGYCDIEAFRAIFSALSYMLAITFLQRLNVHFRFSSSLHLHLHFLPPALALPLPASLRHSVLFFPPLLTFVMPRRPLSLTQVWSIKSTLQRLHCEKFSTAPSQMFRLGCKFILYEATFWRPLGMKQLCFFVVFFFLAKKDSGSRLLETITCLLLEWSIFWMYSRPT